MENPEATQLPDNDEDQQFVQDENTISCPIQYGYRPSVWRYLIFYPIAALPCCIGLLLAYWFPYIWIKLTCSSVPLHTASWVVVKDNNRQWRVEKVITVTQVTDDDDDDDDCSSIAASDESPFINPSSSQRPIKFINHQQLRYLFDETKRQFVLLRGYEQGLSCATIHSMSNGLSVQEHSSRLLRYGSNDIDVPIKPYYALFIEEVLHPFYIFQLFSCILWMIDYYYYYAVAIIIIATLSVANSLIQTRRHMQHLHDMVKSKTDVSVIRNGTIKHGISSEEVVPGDVLVIPRGGMTMPCDSVLLTGNAIVNEATLTGESVPITKTPIAADNTDYSPITHKRHTIFAGTEIIQSRYYSNAMVLAIVIRTGFLTAKGGMIRSILFPKPLNMKFYWDSIKFILMLAVLAAIAFVYTICVLQLRKPSYDIIATIFRAFEIVTTVVPPSLPVAITVGTVYALNRLKKHKIYCISPQRVILCGKVKLVCFDKTGTLTEDSLDILGVQPATSKRFGVMVSDPSELSPGPLLYAMATCHSLTRINAKLSGDPLDMKMFLSTKWELEEPGPDDDRYDTLQMSLVRPKTSLNGTRSSPREQCKEPDKIECEDDCDSVQLGIIKQFTFSSELQRMSVLVRKLPSENSQLIHAFVKGAPEMIKRLSIPDTVPLDFDNVLESLTQKGYRVLAMGYKELHTPWHHSERLTRDAVECDIHFCGLLVMENKLKPETAPVISELLQADIRTVMITGDNLLTAIAVAGTSTMVHSSHRVIVIKANEDMSDDGCPTLSYNVLSSEDGIETILTTSSSSFNGILVGTNHDSEKDNFMAINIDNGRCNSIDIEQKREYYHLAVDGYTFSIIKKHYKQLFKRVCYILHCFKLLLLFLLLAISFFSTVFARMSPNQKAQLVTALMEIGYGVTMCGDGANDCGALKAAHAGISLSETEASVASPFTSKTPNITCVPHLIKEGRDALVTSFSIFKFMALYSLTEFFSAAILYRFESNLGSQQYLYIDLILILCFAFVMGLTGPYPYLVRRRPIGTLAGIHVIVSLLIHIFIMVSFQLGVLFYLTTEHWYVPLVPDSDNENVRCYETSTIFLYTSFIYIIFAVSFSTSAPYRKPIYTNYMFMLVLVLLLPCNLYLALAPHDWLPWLWRFMEIIPSPSLGYRIAIVELAGIHFVIVYLLEGFVFPSSYMRTLLRCLRCKRKPRNIYKHILQEIKDDPTWPPSLPTAKPAHY